MLTNTFTVKQLHTCHVIHINYIKTVHFWLKYNGLAIVRKTTKLIEGGHHGLQDCRHICYYFYVFYVFCVFFQNPNSRDFLRFLPCFVRFLELCSTNVAAYNRKRLETTEPGSVVCPAQSIMIVNCGVKSWKRQRSCTGTLHDDDDEVFFTFIDFDGRSYNTLTLPCERTV